MILGLSISAFTIFHVILSLIGIVAGLVMLFGMLRGANFKGWTAAFLITTILTSITGFMFPRAGATPAQIVGAISLVVLAIALFALYGRHLAGIWRAIFVATAILALYLNTFVALVQAFAKIGILQKLAPTQSDPPFLIAQLCVLAVFLALGYLAERRFHTTPEAVTI